MIEDVGKYLFFGSKDEIDTFFGRAQELGVIEFLPKGKKRSVNLPKDIQDIVTALKILKKEQLDPNILFGEELDPFTIARRAIFLKNSLEKLADEKRQAKQEISKIEVFGNFSLQELHEVERDSSRVIQFFSLKKSRVEKAKATDNYSKLIPIGSDYIHEYFVSISREKQSYQYFVEIKITESLTDIKSKLNQIEKDLEGYKKELVSLKGYEPLLTSSLTSHLNTFHLEYAKDEVSLLLDDVVFAVEAWIPKKYITKLLKEVEDLSIHVEEIAVSEGENVPTHMENKGTSRLGEDLVKIYDVPSVKDKDPSKFVIFAFALFFAMIIADAGYGLIYLSLSIWGLLKLGKKSDTTKRAFKLFCLISSFAVVWGVLTGSYFGIALHPENPLEKCSVLRVLVEKKAKYHMLVKDDVYKEWLDKSPKVKLAATPIEFLLSVKKQEGVTVSYEILDEFTDNILIEIALLVGIIHILFSLARGMRDNLSGIGWWFFIIGGYLYFPTVLDATSILHFLGVLPKTAIVHGIGLQMIWIGLGLSTLLAIIQHKKGGIEEPLKCIQIFADILSYLRLYALALAGMSMASTFNQIGMELGLTFGFLVIIAGHVVNMTLAIMGGFIHGLRLNFLEWYHYCFEGGGKLLNPLRRIK